jgi:hypothetical protein
LKKTDFEIQEIFWRRHILVVNAPLKDEGFSIETLDPFVSLTRQVQMLGDSLGSLSSHSHSIVDVSLHTDGPPKHARGTIVDFVELAAQGNHGRILNVLDLPLGYDFRPSPVYTCVVFSKMKQFSLKHLTGLSILTLLPGRKPGVCRALPKPMPRMIAFSGLPLRLPTRHPGST